MRIENHTQTSPAYRNTAGQSVTNSFQQVMQARAQDSYVPNVNSQSTEGSSGTTVPPSNATRAKLDELAKLNAQADYTGMSYDEIFSSIWNRYNEFFDGNMCAITSCIGGPVDWQHVNNQFDVEIRKHIYAPALHEACKAAGGAHTREEYWNAQDQAGQVLDNARLKVLGYDGMSFDEIEAAINKKYANQNTALDFLKMQGELFLTGVLEHNMGDEAASSYRHMISYQFEVAFNPRNIYTNDIESAHWMTMEQWYRVANQPFNVNQFAGSMREMLTHMSWSGYQVNIEAVLNDGIDRFIGNIQREIDSSVDQMISER